MMRTVVSELRAVASKAPLSISTINTYLSQLDPTLKDQVSVVGWVTDGEVCFAFHFFSARGAAASRALDKRTIVNFADRPMSLKNSAFERGAVRANV